MEPLSFDGDGEAAQRRFTMAAAWLRASTALLNIFGRNIVGDPAWSILLTLYLEGYRGQRSLSVTDACRASGVPMTTALRWIKALETEGFLERQGDRNDARRYLLQLTPAAIWKIHGALDAAAESDKRLGLSRLVARDAKNI
ncbi:helix-turn-helix domain-containing protein [Sphingomonas morindae]|uniref:Winged helix DNA-binding protein n=1 Tax=Sphingomonas morindae TaxID=1541170 RepID=A0ABY4X988_9SPHN|nr:helix-turn-helix domain-containing protein [Sphingomonas morindae]USI73527.1 winged helix DNA-binding protein [Sphingomonas morindae]